ncbi:MAG: FimB/Mfa2 family fimbrial subunit [Proteiniphilum sp.]|jgi:hypothetical protein|nr:FimB/Mfa2 family fimbrial subunit [Proteiniphilum sp.]
MKSIKRQFTRILSAGAILLVLASCVVDYGVDIPDTPDTPNNPGNGEALVKFSVQLPGNASALRSLTQSDENHVQTIDILIFEQGGNWVYNARCSGADIVDGSDFRKKSFTVKMRQGNYDMVMLANARELVAKAALTGKTKSEVLAALTEKMPAGGKWIANSADAAYKLIPMWGNIGNISISGDREITEAENISLTRMLARVDVSVSAENFKLSSIRVYNYNTEGSLAPAAGGWNNSATPPRAIAPNVPAGSVLTKGPVLYDNENGRAEINTVTDNCATEIYIFESENYIGASHTTPEDYLLRTCIVVGGIYGSDSKPTYYRADFSTGTGDDETFLHVLRNHHYTFNITKVSASGHDSPDDAFTGAKRIDFTVGVTPWGENCEIPLEREVALQPTANSYIVEMNKTIAIPLFGQVQKAMAAGDLSVEWIDEMMNLRGELIWAEKGTNEVVKSYTVNVFKSDQNKYNIPILTVTANNEGNALVGVYNDKNRNGVRDGGEGFLWSWHIWVTDYKPVNAGGGFMDRNLGAMNPTPGDPGAIGLHYQFGRKDPFPAATTINGNTQRTVYNSRGEEVAFSAEINASLPYSVNNPANFSTLWSGSNGDTSWDNDGKTAYDPCPSGWKIPAEEKPFGYQTGSTLAKDNTKLGASNASIGGWYPYGGIRTSASVIANTGSRGYFHGAKAKQNNNAYYLDINSNGTVTPGGDVATRSQGLSVRCVRDQFVPSLSTNSNGREIPADGNTYSIRITSNTNWDASIKRGTNEVTVVPGGNGNNSMLGEPLLDPGTGWNGGPSSAYISGSGNGSITVTTKDYSGLSAQAEGNLVIIFRDKATEAILNETTIKVVNPGQ